MSGIPACVCISDRRDERVNLIDLYSALEDELGRPLSDREKPPFRCDIYRYCVAQKGYVHPYDPGRPGWQITRRGLDFISTYKPAVDIAELALKYGMPEGDVEVIRDLVSENMEKEMFSDMMALVEHGIRDDSILSDKYKYSRHQIKKIKKKLGDRLRTSLGRINLDVSEVFA